MSIEEVIRLAVREVVREELRPLLERMEVGRPTAPADDEHLTLAQAAEVAKVHVNTIRRWVEEDLLRARRAGKRKLLVRRSDLERFLENGPERKDEPKSASEIAAAILGRGRVAAVKG